MDVADSEEVKAKIREEAFRFELPDVGAVNHVGVVADVAAGGRETQPLVFWISQDFSQGCFADVGEGLISVEAVLNVAIGVDVNVNLPGVASVRPFPGDEGPQVSEGIVDRITALL